MRERGQYQRPPWGFSEGLFIGAIVFTMLYFAGWQGIARLYGDSAYYGLMLAWRFMTTPHSGWGLAAIVWGWIISIVAGGLGALAAYFSARPNDPSGVRHLDGPRLLRKPPKIGGDGVQILNKWFMKMRDECRHFLFVGSSGGGKTTLIRKLMRQAIKRGDKILVSDPKGDFTSELQEIIIFAPWDKRSVRWEIGKDLNHEDLINEWVGKAIPIPQKGEPVWAQSAQAILLGAILELQHEMPNIWMLSDLRVKLLEHLKNPVKIKNAIDQHLPESSGIVQEIKGKTFASVMLNLSAAMRPLLAVCKIDMKLAEINAGAISLRGWADIKRAKPLVLLHYQAAESMTKAWCAGALDFIVNHYAGLPDCKAQERRTWLFLDEYPQLGRVDSTLRALEILRSKSVRVVIGVQSNAHLKEIYSDNQAQIIEDTTATKVITQLVSSDSGDWASRMVGERVVERYSRSVGGGAGGGSHTQQWVRSEEAVLRANQFKTELTPSETGVRGIIIPPAGRDVYLLHFLFDHVPKLREPREFWSHEPPALNKPDSETLAAIQSGAAEAAAQVGGAGQVDVDMTAWLTSIASQAQASQQATEIQIQQIQAQDFELEEQQQDGGEVGGVGGEDDSDSATDAAGVAAAEHVVDGLLPGAGVLVHALEIADALGGSGDGQDGAGGTTVVVAGAGSGKRFKKKKAGQGAGGAGAVAGAAGEQAE